MTWAEGTELLTVEAENLPSSGKRTCLLVLGMHRSGTSALTRVLSLLGAALPQNLLGAGLGNDTGHWEPGRLVQLHDQMLAEAGSSWDDWRRFNFASLSFDSQTHYKAEIRRLLEEEYGDAPLFVLKEPRICRLVPIYLQALRELEVAVRPIVAFRNPLSVAASLRARDGMNEAQSLLYWLRHVLDAEAATRELPRAFTSYETLLSDWRGCMRSISAALGVDWPRSIDEAAADVGAFLSRSHQHHNVPHGALSAASELDDLIKRAYSAMELLSTGTRADAIVELNAVGATFEPAASIFGQALAAERTIKKQSLTAQQSHYEAMVADAQTKARAKTSELEQLNEQLSSERLEHQHAITLARSDTERLSKQIENERAQHQQAVLESSAELEKLSKQIECDRAQHQQAVSESSDELTRLNQQFAMQTDALIAEAKKQLEQVRSAYESSTSWKLTAPVRRLRRLTQKANGQVARSIVQDEEYAPIANVIQPDNSVSAGGLDKAGTTYALNRIAIQPSFQALSGQFSGKKESIPRTQQDDVSLIAFYLPQFHRVKENSEWWSPGFTEWTNAARGRPNFDGHYQPHIPRELGFYDLANVNIMREQAELARLYGIHGFCFYHYWFSGRQVLERPINNFLKSDIDIKFCICWANENWTRTWDGDTKSVLLEQRYEPEDALSFINSVLPILADDRYIRINGEPILVVYRAMQIPNPSEWFRVWKDAAKKYGLPGLHISVVDFYDITTPQQVGADSLVEFPPHKFNGPQNIPDKVPEFTNPNFAGSVVDYNKIIIQSAKRKSPNFQIFRGIIPSWDNTARRQDTPAIVLNANPDAFGAWLTMLRRWTIRENIDVQKRIIFVNAWNEWGEGCHLEPDLKWGLRYLEQCLKSSYRSIGQLDEANSRTIADALISDLAKVDAAPLHRLDANADPSNDDIADVQKMYCDHKQPPRIALRAAYALRNHHRTRRVAKKIYAALTRYQ